MHLIDLFESDYDHADHMAKTGFWGKKAAGCLFLAAATGRLLFSFRSRYVLEPHTYGTWGGAMDEGETPEEAVRREAEEETFHNVHILDMIPLLVFTVPGVFQYHNFLVVVENEFKPDVHHEDNWETEGFEWVEFGRWPTPLHPGAVKLLNDGASVRKITTAIEHYAGIRS